MSFKSYLFVWTLTILKENIGMRALLSAWLSIINMLKIYAFLLVHACSVHAQGCTWAESLSINFTWKGLKFFFCIKRPEFRSIQKFWIVPGLYWQDILRKITSRLSLVKYFTADILLEILQIVYQYTLHPFWILKQILCPVHSSIYINLTQWVVDNLRNITLMVGDPVSYFDGFGSSGLYYEIPVRKERNERETKIYQRMI